MGAYVRAASIGDLQKTAKVKVNMQGQEIMLARVGDNYYAIEDRCPHLGGELSAGTLEGTVITCPRHGSQFDVTDGRNIRWLKGTGMGEAFGKLLRPPRPVKTFPVKVEGDSVMVEV